MIRLYAVNILPLRDEARFENCYLRSSKERQKKADVLQMRDDKARCIAAGLLLKYAYKKFRIEKIKELATANSFDYVKETGVFPEELPKVVEGLRGKPEFQWPEDYKSKIYFNLSHSGEYVVCALADFEVGADIQMRTRVRDSLLRRFFTENERARVEACGRDEDLRERTFAQIWASKEAETKLTGRGIGQLLESVMRRGRALEKYHVQQGVIEEDYAWAVAGYPESAGGEPEILEPYIVDGGELFYG